MRPTSQHELRQDVLWGQLHALTVVAQLGSFTKAAQRLGLSKAAVSQRIAELERAMGQTLVALLGGLGTLRARVGRVLNPLSSIKTMVRLCCRAFFLMPATPSAASGGFSVRRAPLPGVRDVGN